MGIVRDILGLGKKDHFKANVLPTSWLEHREAESLREPEGEEWTFL